MASGKRRPTSKRTSASASAPRPASRRPPKKGPSSSRAASGRPAATTSESPLRAKVADHSRGPVVFMSTLPRLLIPGLMLGLMLVGLMAPVVFAVPALLIIALFIGWLAYLSWPVLPGRQRAVRVAVISLVLLAAVGRIAGVL